MRRLKRATLARAPEASCQARRMIATACADWRITDVEPDAGIVATELVENTLRHTTSVPRLRLVLQNGELTVAVSDTDPVGSVTLGRPEPPQHRGLGTLLVSRLAKRWGCTRSRRGKTVWAVLSADLAAR